MSVPRQRIRIRRATAAQWTASNPVLLDGELATESDTRKLKVGDGVTTWNSLGYVADSSGFDGTLGSITDVNTTGKVGKSILYYDVNSGQWKGDDINTVVTITDGGNW